MYNFAEASYVTYGLGQSLLINPRISDYFVMVRTREPTGLIWTIANENTYEHITLEVSIGSSQDVFFLSYWVTYGRGTDIMIDHSNLKII